VSGVGGVFRAISALVFDALHRCCGMFHWSISVRRPKGILQRLETRFRMVHGLATAERIMVNDHHVAGRDLAKYSEIA
jgi:hypothetical protein